MKAMTANAIRGNPSRNKYLIPAMILAAVILIGFLAYRAQQKPGAVIVSTLSQADLEEQYGLRVRLVAVTAGGGMVDVRLKIVDAEKAKTLLQDPKNFPALWIADSNITLAIPEDTKSQEIKFENDSIIFILFPNARGVVHPGTPVILLFGDVRMEPIAAK